MLQSASNEGFLLVIVFLNGCTGTFTIVKDLTLPPPLKKCTYINT